MSDERWLKSRAASREVLELLEHARAPRALDAETRARSRRRLASLSVLPAAAGLAFWYQKVALAALLGAAVGGAVLVPQWLPSKATPGGPSPVRSSRSITGSPRARPAPHVAVESPAPSPSLRAAPPQSPPGTAPSGPRSSSIPEHTGGTGENIAREARLLERARSLLATNPSGALVSLLRHAREFPEGALLVEREFLRIDALVRLGRMAEAQTRARALEARAPGHLYEQRLRSILGRGRPDSKNL